MGNQTVEQGALEQRLKRLEALFVVLFAHNGDWPEDERFLREVLVHMGQMPDTAFFEEMLHLVFRRRPRGRLAELAEQLANVEAVTRANQATLHEHLSLALLGGATEDLSIRRIVPIRLHVKQYDARLRDVLTEAIAVFAGSLELVICDDLPVEKGTNFRKWFARTLGPARQSDVRARIEEGVRALELHALQDSPSAGEQERVTAAGALINCLEHMADAVLQLGSLVLVSGSRGWVARSLSQSEEIHLQRHPELLANPESILAFLRSGAQTTLEPRAA